MNTHTKHRLLATALLSCAMLSFCGTAGGCSEKISSVNLGNVMILGDSYSTFEGFIPEGYGSWYRRNATHTNVTDENDTWWHTVMRRTRSSLLLNCSYSGSTVCNTGYDGADYSSISFITRFRELKAKGFFDENRIDTLIILGGLNDFWAGAPVGEIKYDGVTDEDLYSFLPALCTLLSEARAVLPNARILFIGEEYISRELKDGFKEICEHVGIEYLELAGISKGEGHPDKAGMKSIAEQVIDYFEKNAPDTDTQ